MEMETENTPKTTNTSDKLLLLRKEYKKTTVAMAKARAHLNFISSCAEKHQTPKGLKVNERCSAFLSDLSDVKDQFAYTSNIAEEGFVTHLGHHYNVVVQELQSLLLDTMATVEETQATQKERKQHTDMLRKTNSPSST